MPNSAESNRLPTISIVGPGSLGTALALALPTAGYRVELIAVRSKGAREKALARKLKALLVETGTQPLATDVVWITVPDDAISAVASVLANLQNWKGKVALHSSGALTSDALAALRDQGASVASAHPMMTFVRDAMPDLAGVFFGLEGDAPAVRMARSIVRAVGGEPFDIKKRNKVLYHAFGSFASPLVIALMASLEQVALASGIRRQDIKPIMVPLLWQTLTNYLKHDAASAFSGPLARGDVATVRQHLVALKMVPEAREVYVALARAALKRLPVKNGEALGRQLKSVR